MILLSRIFFNTSLDRKDWIRKTAIPLVLVEALYAIKGLDHLVQSKVTRQSSTTPNSSQQQQQQQQQQQPIEPMLNTSYKQSDLIRPTFVFRFYCRGECATGECSSVQNHQKSLKLALNDALLYFLSEYLTRIEPELYLTSVELKKTPVAFRRPSTKRRPRSANTSNADVDVDVDQASIYMKKSARETILGKLIQSSFNNDKQLIQFVIANFSNNLFDQRDYQNTIEYFRESLRNFDSSRIFNSLISEPSSLSSSTEDIDDTKPRSDAEEFLSSSHSSVSSFYSALKKKPIEIKPEETQEDEEEDGQDETSSKMSYLRVLYEWLRGLYKAKQKAVVSVISRSHGAVFFGSAGQPRVAQQSSGPSPSALPTAPISSFIFHKKLYYKVKTLFWS